jgi:hypothetical protein
VNRGPSLPYMTCEDRSLLRASTPEDECGQARAHMIYEYLSGFLVDHKEQGPRGGDQRAHTPRALDVPLMSAALAPRTPRAILTV